VLYIYLIFHPNHHLPLLHILDLPLHLLYSFPHLLVLLPCSLDLSLQLVPLALHLPNNTLESLPLTDRILPCHLSLPQLERQSLYLPEELTMIELVLKQLGVLVLKRLDFVIQGTEGIGD
jgi:hypothetical protein